MTHVMFVCTGNTCRSPLAEALLRRKLADRGVEGVSVSSAGTGAWEGAPASEGAYLVGLEHGLDLSDHRARLLSREVAAAATLILTMARHHRARVEQLGTATEARVLGEYSGRGDAEVADPFGGDLELYREVLAELDAMLEGVADRLARERLGDRR
ncbi:MAG: low molecular weight protein arginine phosphatase [Gemmatimonadota bacterium]|nr:low molecular weight protein arginine phosphatase [Gemmatimonadota bacterium]MDH4347214.1 low molecular weight protein arginine phosphatase [Gemmatimonadota bacterium]MDH5282410.1 low molecular weight protein arginine phosphatase [Gemmatimonadota bacterium]